MSLKNTIRTFFIFSLLSVSVTACYVPTASTTTTAPTDTVVVPNTTTQSSTVTGSSTITTSVSPVVTPVPTDNNGNVVFVSPSTFPSSVYATAPSQSNIYTSSTPSPTPSVYSSTGALNGNASGSSILQPSPNPTTTPVF